MTYCENPTIQPTMTFDQALKYVEHKNFDKIVNSLKTNKDNKTFVSGVLNSVDPEIQEIFIEDAILSREKRRLAN